MLRNLLAFSAALGVCVGLGAGRAASQSCPYPELEPCNLTCEDAEFQPTCPAAERTADVAYLRTDCSGQTGPCKTSLGEMSDWIDDCRCPTTEAPLLVDVGPGSFEGTYFCWGKQLQGAPPFFFPQTRHKGHVTFRGAGRAISKLNGQHPFRVLSPVFVGNCEVAFQRLSLDGASYGVNWEGEARPGSTST